MKRYTRIISALTVTLLLAIFFTTTAFASGTNTAINQNTTDHLSKAALDLFVEADKKDDKYLVMVFCKEIDVEEINEKINENTIFNPELYTDSEKYYEIKYPELASDVLNVYGEAALAPIEGLASSEIFTPIEMAMQEDYNNFISAQRSIIKSSYSEINTKLIRDLDIKQADIVYRGSYTSTIIAYATQETIAKLCAHPNVEAVLPYSLDNGEAVPACSDDIHEIVGTDSVNGTKSSQYNSGSGYKGSGIKIGIIESGLNICDSNSPQLSSIAGRTLIRIPLIDQNETVDSHSTLVTSIIVGQKVTYNGTTYEGIVPNATVYYTSISEGALEYYNSLISLLDEGVTVVSSSLHFIHPVHLYINYEIERIIRTTGLSLVCSAGNLPENANFPNATPDDYPIGTLGSSYNVITVGNLNTTVYDNGYYMSDTSLYVDALADNNIRYIAPAKPDLVAPGKEISCLGQNNTIITYNGTSFSTPIVAGIVAQMQQCNPALKTSFNEVKAILMASADNTIIKDDTSVHDNPYLKDKSGAGLVNAKRAIELTQTTNVGTITAFASGSIIPYNNKKTVYVPEGHKLKVFMVYSRSDALLNSGTSEEIIFGISSMPDNLDLYLVAQGFNENSPNPYTSSVSTRNNVEVIEYVSQTGGNYVIWVKPTTIVPETGGKTIPFAICWTIEAVE